MAAEEGHEDDHHSHGDAAAPLDGSPSLGHALSSAPSMYSWSDLPKEILELFAEKLYWHADLMQFSCVNKLWNSVIMENHKRLSYHLPMCYCLHQKLPVPLLMRSCNNEDTVMEFLSLSDNRVYGNFCLPEMRNKSVAGSSKGWLVTIDILSDELHILNPLTRVQMQLPSFSPSQISLGSYPGSGLQYDSQEEGTEDEGTDDEGPPKNYHFVKKVVLSSDPKFSSKGCVALAVVAGNQTLSFSKLGDDKWTSIRTSPFAVEDAIYYKERFYVAGHRGLLATIHSMGPDAEAKIVARGPNAEEPTLGYPCRKYLVESSSGELLLVVRMVDKEQAFKDVSVWETIGFAVFRLHMHPASFSESENGATDERYSEQQYVYDWVKLESLEGDMLFLGKKFFYSCSFTLASLGQSKLYLLHGRLFGS